jgi:hypothetical protein
MPGVMLLVVVALAFAVLKPWSWFPDQAAGVAASALTSLAPSASRVPTKTNGFEDLVYDPSIFGIHEPQAAWALWPATFLVTFGFVFQVPELAAAPPSQPGASVSPSPAASARASPSGSEGPAATQGQTPDGGPAWPAQFTSPAGYHLFLIGVDMPAGYSLSAARLFRVLGDGTLQIIDLAQLESPWPEHFAVIGIPGPAGTNRLAVWAPGTYRLSLTFDPNARVMRTVEIDVEAPPRS